MVCLSVSIESRGRPAKSAERRGGRLGHAAGQRETGSFRAVPEAHGGVSGRERLASVVGILEALQDPDGGVHLRVQRNITEHELVQLPQRNEGVKSAVDLLLKSATEDEELARRSWNERRVQRIKSQVQLEEARGIKAGESLPAGNSQVYEAILADQRHPHCRLLPKARLPGAEYGE
jgi:hypothetical protein